MEHAGTRDIEGKVTRVGASRPGGERVSKKEEERSETDSNENLAFSQGQPDLNSAILNEIKFQNW